MPSESRQYPHRIRLRGPWDYEPLTRMLSLPDGGCDTEHEDVPKKGRMNLPGRWRDGGLPDFAGRVRFMRCFGYPGRIDHDEQVWLTFEGIAGTSQIRLNGQPLGEVVTVAPAAFEITELLLPRNELVVDVESATPDGGIWGEVALEIRCVESDLHPPCTA